MTRADRLHSFPGLTAQAIAEVRRDCDPRLRSYVLKYSADQPRVPAGNPDGGQWTDGDEDEPLADPSDATADPIGNDPSPDDMVGGRSTGGTQYAELDTETRTDATAGPPPISGSRDNSGQRPVEVAGNDWRNLPVNLPKEATLTVTGDVSIEGAAGCHDGANAPSQADVGQALRGRR